MPTEEDNIEAYWEDLPGPAPRDPQEEPQPETPEVLRAQVNPGDFVIGTRNRPLVVIKPDGTLVYGEGYTPDEAAVIFWEEMGRRRLEMEERILLFQHLESTVTRLGVADLRYEACQRQLSAQPTPETAREVGQAHRTLENAVHQTIELGRGLANRPGVRAPRPERIPRQIAEDPNNSYGEEQPAENEPTVSEN